MHRLFETLDTTTRRVTLPSGRLAVFTDTVGFISDLPHQLIKAFRVSACGRARAEDSEHAEHVGPVSHEVVFLLSQVMVPGRWLAGRKQRSSMKRPGFRAEGLGLEQIGVERQLSWRLGDVVPRFSS